MTSCVTVFEKLYWYSFVIFKKIIEKHFIYKDITCSLDFHRLDFYHLIIMKLLVWTKQK